jgi:hypothetical protein
LKLNYNSTGPKAIPSRRAGRYLCRVRSTTFSAGPLIDWILTFLLLRAWIGWMRGQCMNVYTKMRKKGQRTYCVMQFIDVLGLPKPQFSHRPGTRHNRRIIPAKASSRARSASNGIKCSTACRPPVGTISIWTRNSKISVHFHRLKIRGGLLFHQFSFQTVKANRVVAIQFLKIPFTSACQRPVEQLDPASDGYCLRGNRPIRTENKTIKAKRRHRRVYEWSDLFPSPVSMICFCSEARQLTINVLSLTKFL